MTLYETLGVEPSATQTKIKMAYRRLVKKWHPDLNKSPEAGTEFQKIQHAYDVLGDPVRRAVYDRSGEDEDWKAPPPDPMQHRAAEVIRQSIETVIIGHRGSLPGNVNFITTLQSEIDAMISMIRANSAPRIVTHLTEARFLQSILDRIKVGNRGAEDYVSAQLSQQIDRHQREAEMLQVDMNDRIAVMERARTLLSDPRYNYTMDKPTARAWPQPIPETLLGAKLW